MAEALTLAIGGHPESFYLKSFDVLSARAFAPAVRNLCVHGAAASPLQQGLLWAGLVKLSADRGGAVARSFQMTGLHDEALRPDPHSAPTAQTSGGANSPRLCAKHSDRRPRRRKTPRATNGTTGSSSRAAKVPTKSLKCCPGANIVSSLPPTNIELAVR